MLIDQIVHHQRSRKNYFERKIKIAISEVPEAVSHGLPADVGQQLIHKADELFVPLLRAFSVVEASAVAANVWRFSPDAIEASMESRLLDVDRSDHARELVVPGSFVFLDLSSLPVCDVNRLGILLARINSDKWVLWAFSGGRLIAEMKADKATAKVEPSGFSTLKAIAFSKKLGELSAQAKVEPSGFSTLKAIAFSKKLGELSAQLPSDFDPVFANSLVECAWSALALINSLPDVVKVSSQGRRGAFSQDRKRLNMPEQVVFSEVCLNFDTVMRSDESGTGDPQRTTSSGRRLHFCRAHLRRKNGRMHWVREHLRGDREKGVVMVRHAMKGSSEKFPRQKFGRIGDLNPVMGRR